MYECTDRCPGGEFGAEGLDDQTTLQPLSELYTELLRGVILGDYVGDYYRGC